jgi:CRP-like cAMP-binding protein
MLLSQENLLLLQEVPLFRQIGQDAALSRLALNLEEVQFPAGQTILHQGEPGKLLYILITGRVKVHLGEFQIASLEPGAYFGEMSLLDSQPHSASVTTLEPSRCWVLTQAQLFQAIAQSPEIGLHIIRVLSDRIRRLNLHISTWMRGLLTVAWADGQFDPEEKQVIEQLVQTDLCPNSDLGTLQPITGPELAAGLADEAAIGENFLRMAVIVALANGTYSESEERVLQEFCKALRRPSDILQALGAILVPDFPTGEPKQLVEAGLPTGDVLQPVRYWLDNLEIDSPYKARFLCKLIPSQCPFERDIVLFGRKIVHIPPMCKLNPLYEQLVSLRFRALSYLADVCGEDVTPYLT